MNQTNIKEECKSAHLHIAKCTLFYPLIIRIFKYNKLSTHLQKKGNTYFSFSLVLFLYSLISFTTTLSPGCNPLTTSTNSKFESPN